MLIKLKVKGRIINGITEPDLPEHHCNWRVNQYNPKLNEFSVTEEVDDLPSNLSPYLVVEIKRDIFAELDDLKVRVEKLEKK